MNSGNFLKQYSHILFDLDGTVTDSAEGILNSIRHCLTHFRIDHPEPAFLRKFIGPPLIQSLVEHYGFDSIQAKKAVTVYREYFRRKGIFENQLYPGIPELFRKLHDQGKIMILATAKPTFYAKKIVRHFQLGKYLTEVVGSNMDGTRMEKEEIIRHILTLYADVPRENFIMIGDRKHDIQGARRHGLDSVWVRYGYGDEAEIHSLEPTFTAGNADELYQLLV